MLVMSLGANSFSQWHLSSAVDINVSDVWSSNGGSGITVAVVDDGIQSSHSNLAHAIGEIFQATETVTGCDGDPAAADHGHGTAVAGLIAAGGQGGVHGIAPGVELASLRIFGENSFSIADAFALAGAYDVVNNSWGYSQGFVSATPSSMSSYWQPIMANIDSALAYGRDGLGSVIVKSAGNDRQDGRNANDDLVATHTGVIVVAATDYKGEVSFYSTPGANVLVSAPSSGGGRGVTTTDLTGSAGYSVGSSTDKFGGTSAAAPMVSGVAALVLEANAGLSWHEVQSILAITATHTGSAVGAAPRGFEMFAWQTNAATSWNGGGMHHSNDYGFGLVDAAQAVRLAETWDLRADAGTYLQASAPVTGWQVSAGNVATGIVTLSDQIDLQTATLDFGMTRSLSSVEAIHVISPSGTRSTVHLNEDSSSGFVTSTQWAFASEAFRGEGTAGTWTIEIDFSASASIPSLSATLIASGTAATENDVYYYTSEFAEFGASILTDASGADTINAAALASDTHLDLTPGSESRIDGATLVIAADTWIEAAVTGAGNDVVIGNAAANVLWTGEGDDQAFGGAGDDLFYEAAGRDHYDGGTGTDTVIVTQNYIAAAPSISRTGDELIVTLNGEQNTFVSIERMAFADGQNLAFDNTGNAGQIYRVYETAFNRTPDAEGFAYWLSMADSGIELQTIASLFTRSQEYADLYSNGATASDKVAAFYRNSLDREPDAHGLTSWSQAYAANAIQDIDILLGFSESLEKIGQTQSIFDDGFVF